MRHQPLPPQLPLLVFALNLGLGLGCEQRSTQAPAQTPAPAQAPWRQPAPIADLDAALIAKGKARMEHFQCNRCHDGSGLETPPQDKHCVHCHQAIEAETYKAAPHLIQKWKAHITHLIEVPTLDHAQSRLRRDWMIKFLQQPHDLRPRLEEMMPRLDVNEDDAQAIAAALMPKQYAPETPLPGDLARGESLIQSKGCISCHSFTGAKALRAEAIPIELEPTALAHGMKLATDLRYARERVRPQALVAWLLDPPALKPGTPMPKLPMSEQEARDIAAFILQTPLGATPKTKVPERLPVLTRKVAWDEVQREVFHFVCWHCHSEADYVRGDGGPGNTGGFGFKPRKLSLADYSAISSGLLDHSGARISAFTKDERGTPLIVRAMMARYHEVYDEPVPGIRGMPLGLPPMPLEKIQLVESWIAQGRPR